MNVHPDQGGAPDKTAEVFSTGEDHVRQLEKNTLPSLIVPTLERGNDVVRVVIFCELPYALCRFSLSICCM